MFLCFFMFIFTFDEVKSTISSSSSINDILLNDLERLDECEENLMVYVDKKWKILLLTCGCYLGAFKNA